MHFFFGTPELLGSKDLFGTPSTISTDGTESTETKQERSKHIMSLKKKTLSSVSVG